MPDVTDKSAQYMPVADKRDHVDDYPFTVSGMAAAAENERVKAGRPVPHLSHVHATCEPYYE